MVNVSALWVEAAARRKLAALQDQLAAGLLAAAAVPGLGAVVDQHSAAVRDIVTYGVEGSAAVAGVVLLAGYASGLIDRAKEIGWGITLPSDWTHADWLTSRLLAVCALAERFDEPGYRRPVALG